MNILFVSGHPAQVHNFRNVRAELIKHGHNVFWLTTPKDIATNLLDAYGIPYQRLHKPSKGLVSKAWTLLRNVIWEIGFLRRNKIDVAITRTCPYTTIAAKLCGVKHIIIDDTEHAAEQMKRFSDQADAIVVPECFWFQLRKDELRFPGNIELHYLHPKRFTPKPVWDLLGIESGTRFAIVRFVKWDAWHDTQLVGGFTLDQKRTLIQRLQAHLRVFISSESELPADLEPYRIQIPIERMHDVQAAAALFVGESATMASESVVLGTPAVYIDEVGRGYTDEEARKGLLWMFRPVPNRYHLSISPAPVGSQISPLHSDSQIASFTSETDVLACSSSPNSAPANIPLREQPSSPSSPSSSFSPSSTSSPSACSLSPTYAEQKMPLREQAKQEPWWITGGVEECIAKAEEIASPDFDTASYVQRHEAWMATKIDCTAFLTYFIEEYPKSAEQTRQGGAEFWDRFK